MKVYTIVLLLAAVVFVECGHTFMGTNVMRPLVFDRDVRYSSRFLQKRVKYLNYTLPAYPSYYGYHSRSIQGILAYDLTNSSATANITHGGVGYNYVTLRMKSARNMQLHYHVYIYA